MKLYQREQLAEILTLLRMGPRHIIFITGPRQAGKTTLARQALAQAGIPHQYVPLDDPEAKILSPSHDRIQQETFTSRTDSPAKARDISWIVRLWENARTQALNSESGFILVLDEIQQVPDWSPTVKGLWDMDRINEIPLHVILLGSAPLLMQKGMNKESMLGRYITIPVPHWSFLEMRDAFGFSLEQYIFFGGYPGSAALIADEVEWQRFIADAIIGPNIERDILAMERIDNPALLKRLFEFGAECSGEILSYRKLLGKTQGKGNPETLIRYLDLLSKAGLVSGLDKYGSNLYRQKISSPKLNVHNTALMSARSGHKFEEAVANKSLWGRLTESAVGMHLLNTKSHMAKLFYWREDDFEVDFVLKRGPHLIAIEAKSGRQRSYPLAFTKFKERFKHATPVLVGSGGMPVSEFLSIPARDLPEGL